MFLKPRYRLRAKHFLSRVTPLTWLIWALLLSDLSAPGYLRFHLVTTTIDAREFIESAIDSGQTATDSLGDVRVTKTGELDP